MTNQAQECRNAQKGLRCTQINKWKRAGKADPLLRCPPSGTDQVGKTILPRLSRQTTGLEPVRYQPLCRI